jgi:2-phospho-L-lactate transferase/gluconeogenesis factor (CofD/UPF0052 family)
MTPQSGGRHCKECDKTVKDFTSLTNDEISTYLTEHAGEKICGRFSDDQLRNKSITSSNKIEEDFDSNIDCDDSLLLVENMVLGMLEPITLDFDIPDVNNHTLMGEVEIDYEEDK